MLPQSQFEPAPAPALPPLPLPMAAPRQLEPLDMDDDDKGKVSRWQIGSTSLSVLEQVYAMEPFPGDARATCGGARPCCGRFWVPEGTFLFNS